MSRVQDILKGYAGRSVEQPPPMERSGCSVADLATGMERALEGEPRVERAMWRAALSLGMSAMARAVEFSLDVGRREAFDPSQHKTWPPTMWRRCSEGACSTRWCGWGSAKT